MRQSNLWFLALLLIVFLAGCVVGRVVVKRLSPKDASTKSRIIKTPDMTIIWIDKAGVEK